MKTSSVVFIYVSHHSETYINRFIQYHKKELSDHVYLVNSSAKKIDLKVDINLHIIDLGKNIGFSAANNLAIYEGIKAQNAQFFVLINPDVYLPENWFSSIIQQLENATDQTGIYTVPLLAYDFKKDRPNGKIDSNGIFSTWYGRWYDALQGEKIGVLTDTKERYEIPAACGALMILSREIVDELLITDGFVFNESFFMYKEDIELSIRIRALNKKIMMIPSVPAYHCRGWASNRSDSTFWVRKLSARNELKMHGKFYWRYLPYSIMKYSYVVTIERFIFSLLRLAR